MVSQNREPGFGVAPWIVGDDTRRDGDDIMKYTNFSFNDGFTTDEQFGFICVSEPPGVSSG
tara:strand:- start:203 stop:385 length:183 start_codon:yes stop_codon:yes gene_type:complete